MTYSAEAPIDCKLVSKWYGRRLEMLLLAATLLKVLVILFFFQHVIDYRYSTPRIVSSYGWNQLVSSMYQGKYEIVIQSDLSDIYDLKSYSYRPPIYPIFLFMATYVSNYSASVVVFLQSIITSLVAYFGYKIVRLSTGKKRISIVCLWTLFLFPMNFLKSGTIDEAPLMLVFVLASLYTFGKYVRNQNRLGLLFLSAALLGLSTLTRFTTLFIALGILLLLMLSPAIKNRYRMILLFISAYLVVLSPWVFRNYLLYNKLVLTSGGGRILLFTQSEEFIQSFPYESPDSIERRYLRSFHKSHEYLSQLDSFSLDEEFKRYAISEAISCPKKYCRAFISKLKTFVPYRYFAVQDRPVMDIVYVSCYSLSLLFFVLSILKRPHFKAENVTLLIALVSMIIPGVVYFMLSRHLYPPMILMIIFSYIACSNAYKNRTGRI